MCNDLSLKLWLEWWRAICISSRGARSFIQLRLPGSSMPRFLRMRKMKLLFQSSQGPDLYRARQIELFSTCRRRRGQEGNTFSQMHLGVSHVADCSAGKISALADAAGGDVFTVHPSGATFPCLLMSRQPKESC